MVIDWLELQVREHDDGSFEAYEALTDTRRRGTWKEIRERIENTLLSETEDEINRQKGENKE